MTFVSVLLVRPAYLRLKLYSRTTRSSVNVVVDDTNDLSEFSKEELISSLIDDADED